MKLIMVSDYDTSDTKLSDSSEAVVQFDLTSFTLIRFLIYTDGN